MAFFLELHVLFRQPPSLSLEALGSAITPSVMSQFSKSVPLVSASTCLAFLVCIALAVGAAYQGAGAAGSGPGGWGIHMVFVLPAVVFVGVACTIVGNLFAVALPLPLWVRGVLSVVVAVFGGYFAAFGLFRRLNPPRPLPSPQSLTRRSSERPLAVGRFLHSTFDSASGRR